MANIRPFQAIKPKKGLETEIAALPYDVYNRQEACEVVKTHPHSFLRIDRAETQFGEEVDTYADCVYRKAHDLLWDMVDKGEFVKDETSCYYIYELEMDGRKQTGIVACASVDDYLNNVIKKHENTREDKELDRIRHVKTCGAQTGPIFLAYRNHKAISEVVTRTCQGEAIYDFVAEDGIAHRVYQISDQKDIQVIQEGFAGIGQIYIADGHHRCASAVKVGLEKRKEHPDYTGQEEFNYFLSVLFPDDQLMIMDYNRVVKDLNGLSEKEFIERFEKVYDIKKMGKECVKPNKKGQVAMYISEEWYLCDYRKSLVGLDPVSSLDVSLLQNEVLEPVLGIHDPKTDQRIDFVGGIRGMKELEKRVHIDSKVAFAMYPTSIQELFAVADAGLLMPPKSTWFEPKLRSGLFIHEI